MCVFALPLQYRAHPKRFPGAGLGKYLELAEKLHMPDEDILLDMHQMICVGAYGGVTSSVCPLNNPPPLRCPLALAGGRQIEKTEHCAHILIGSCLHFQSMKG